MSHQHVTQQCATHGHRLGGCKCLSTPAEPHRYEQVPCSVSCPERRDPEPEGGSTWKDIYMGEVDVP